MIASTLVIISLFPPIASAPEFILFKPGSDGSACHGHDGDALYGLRAFVE
jgi:hypothetical protein